MNAPHPFIQLRAADTKGKRADVLPVRADLADLLRKAKGDAGDGDAGDGDAVVSRMRTSCFLSRSTTGP